MAGRKEPFETRIVRSERKAARLVGKGWEVVSTQPPWTIGAAPTITLRRPNPKYRNEKEH